MNSLYIKGRLSAELIRENGEVVRQQKDNIIVNVGFDFIPKLPGLSRSNLL